MILTERCRKVDCMSSHLWCIEIEIVNFLDQKTALNFYGFSPITRCINIPWKNFNYFSFGGVDVGPCTFLLLFPSYFFFLFRFCVDIIFIFRCFCCISEARTPGVLKSILSVCLYRLRNIARISDTNSSGWFRVATNGFYIQQTANR